MNEKKLKGMLYKSFETELNENEKKLLENALNNSAVLRREKEKIETVRSYISSEREDDFKPLFEERVIEKINTDEITLTGLDPFFDALVFSFRKIIISALALILILSSLRIYAAKEISTEALLGISQISLADIYDPTTIFTMD